MEMTTTTRISVLKWNIMLYVAFVVGRKRKARTWDTTLQRATAVIRSDRKSYLLGLGGHRVTYGFCEPRTRRPRVKNIAAKKMNRVANTRLQRADGTTVQQQQAQRPKRKWRTGDGTVTRTTSVKERPDRGLRIDRRRWWRGWG